MEISILTINTLEICRTRLAPFCWAAGPYNSLCPIRVPHPLPLHVLWEDPCFMSITQVGPPPGTRMGVAEPEV